MKRCWMSLVLLAVMGSIAHCAPPAAKPGTYLDPANAGPDYAIQGEYAAEAAPWAAQLIATGNGQFRAVFHAGGLPGAGWDAKTKLEIDGKLDSDKVVLEDPARKISATLSGHVLAGRIEDQAFELKKVHRQSPTLGAAPPAGAVVLFDGTPETLANQWAKGKLDDRGLLAVQGGGALTKQSFGDFTLHLEFITPFMPGAKGQGRGNSGVYIQQRYEVQVLDSFGLGGADNECGGIYKNARPAVNMCLPPLTWQTYDIDFTAARYNADGTKASNARATVRHNGVASHENQESKGATGGGTGEKPPATGDHLAGPLYLPHPPPPPPPPPPRPPPQK